MRQVRGTAGNDTLSPGWWPHAPHEFWGEGGDDTITGGQLGDILHGGAGRDKLSGGRGDDTLDGGADPDIMDGGDDIDTATYETSGAGVSVDLSTGRGRGGDANGDTLKSIENLTGSRFADTLIGNGVANVLMGGYGADTLDGRDGIDTASYADSKEGVKVSLALGTGSGGSADGDTLKNIENLTGSAYADSLFGDAGDNVLDGGAGDDFLQGAAGRDTLTGGDGVDTVSYADSNVGVGVSLSQGFAVDDVDGDGNFDEEDQTDTLSQVENVTGSAFADEIDGNGEANVLKGGDGDDDVNGKDGDDTLEGGAGRDELRGGDDNDTLLGGGDADELKGGYGDDWLEGGAGADDIDGGQDTDTVSYATSNAGVFVDLLNGTAEGGHAHNDTLTSIENLEGSVHGDVLKGTNYENVIKGGDGDDVIQGRSGVDEIWGGAGNDTFVFDEADQQNSILPWNIEGIADFTAGGTEDVLDLTLAGTGYTSLADILANAEEVTGDNGAFGTMIDLGPAGAVVLVNVAMADLTEADFVFADAMV